MAGWDPLEGFTVLPPFMGVRGLETAGLPSMDGQHEEDEDAGEVRSSRCVPAYLSLSAQDHLHLVWQWPSRPSAAAASGITGEMRRVPGGAGEGAPKRHAMALGRSRFLASTTVQLAEPEGGTGKPSRGATTTQLTRSLPGHALSSRCGISYRTRRTGSVHPVLGCL